MTELSETKAIPIAPMQTVQVTAVVRIFAIFAVVAALSGVVALTAGGYWLSTFTKSYCTVLAVLGCTLLYGQLGLVSLCQWALVGVGGWVALRVYHSFHPPFVVTMLAAGAGASVVGMIWGLPALRMRGLYLALATLMLAGAFQSLINVTRFPVGGPGFLGQVGASGNERVMMARPIFASSDVGYFLFCGVVVALAILLVELHRNAKPGRAWALIRKNEQMAMASGVRVVFYKAWAFALAGFLAGVGGALLAGTFGQLEPTGGFSPTDSIIIFIGTLLGGPGVWLGAFAGGVLTAVIPGLLVHLDVQTYLGFVIFGAALLLGLSDPIGIGGHLTNLAARLYARLVNPQAP
jgi:branched-chain amino acid transport system permease protein